MLPFTVLDADGRVVGMTTYMNVDATNKRVEIGSTWYAARVQRGPLNTECKLLLLAHAFDTLDCIAVEFRTHRFNTQSRRAIERLGRAARRHPAPHQVSPTAPARHRVYSIIAAEWPTVQDAPALAARQARAEPGCSPPTGGGHAMAKKKLDVDNLWKLERVGRCRCRPTARRPCVGDAPLDGRQQGEPSMWLLSTFGGEPRA